MIWHIYVFSLRPSSFNIFTIMMTINTVREKSTSIEQMFPGKIKQICVSLWWKKQCRLHVELILTANFKWKNENLKKLIDLSKK